MVEQATGVSHSLEHQSSPGLMHRVRITSYKGLGARYLSFSLVMFFIGEVMALLIRAELARPGVQLMGPELASKMSMARGLIMIFGVIVPALVGLANWLAPVMTRTPERALPPINGWSFWILPLAFALLLLALLIAGSASALGWAPYVPQILRTDAAFKIFAVQLMGISSITAAIHLKCLVVGLTGRAAGDS